MPEACKGKIEILVVDVSKEDSVKAAAAALTGKLGNSKLYGLVNNAGVGLSHEGVTNDDIINTNTYGVKWMTENFIPLIDATNGRIVNVGSGAGPMFAVKQTEEDLQAFWLNKDLTWDKLHEKIIALMPTLNAFEVYAMSKTALSTYSAMMAQKHPNLKISSISPGLVDTAIVAKFSG
jgi:carbonyl reductase 1